MNIKFAITLLVGIIVAGIMLSNEVSSKGNAEEPANETSIKDTSGKATAPKETSASKAYELPAHTEKDYTQIIEHTGHTLCYNKKHNTPDWVAWSLTRAHADGSVERCTKFWADEQVDTRYRVDYYEYKGSGYDRGHMCPAGDNKWSEKAMHDCFYMTNMCPQEPSLNSGAWKHLEEKCRDWAIAEGRIYIVCGPIWRGKSHEKIGIDHSIDVPEAFFKAVLSMRKGHEKAIAFIYENSKNIHQSLPKTACSVDKVEETIKLDLFHMLDDSIEEKVESNFNLDDWK